MTVRSWITGLVVALVFGAVITWGFLAALRWYVYGKRPIYQNEANQKPVPAWLVGTMERLFFTGIIAFEVTAAAVAMVAWLALKMATDWNRINAPYTPSEALTGLLGGLVSMLFALIGGLICSGRISSGF